MPRTKLFDKTSTNDNRRASTILKGLLPLMPPDVRQRFVDENQRRGLFHAGDGSTWRFWTGEDGSGWCVSSFGEEGMAIVFAPDQTVTAL